ncbi:glycosyltransferase family 4 protein [Desulfopila sp. IMCC35008]|uniref:glycosyltransferase family 4 protein n=1 Tax=Desulfopila sp. IMCC35008 TaxID=2653858 RepID=UPI001F10A4C4|nr:glycosyltransferase family 4 protein [Desulfopila sp. IMCC35008]
MVDKKLKIVQVLPELDEGGVEGETFDFAVYLAQKGHESIVISGGGRMVEALEKCGCRHIHWPHVGEKSYRCLKYINRFRRFFQDENIDIFHLRSRLPAWLGYLAWKTLPPTQRPALVTTFHGFYSVNSYSTIMTRGERVVAVSKTIKEHILDNYGTSEDRISLIHGGFDEQQFNADNVTPDRIDTLREQWGVEQGDDPVIILPGRLTQWKGQDYFIDSLAQVKSPFLALLVGDVTDNPSFTKKLQERIENYGLQDKVKLVGHCNDMPAALLAGDLVVSASSTQPEAFGKVAIEAMAMGKPIIATAHGGSLETVVDGKTGWLVEPLNVRQMSERICKSLANRDELKKVGSAGRQWVLDHFTADVMCRKTENLYFELLEEKRKRSSREQITVMQMLPDLDGGGVERGTLEMGGFLASEGHRSFVVSSGGRMVEQLENEGTVHVPMKVGSKSPIVLKYFFPLRRLIKKEQVDILHLRSRMPAWLGYLVWRSLPQKNRPVLITTFHGFYSVNAYSAIMTKGEGIIAVSESIKNHITEHYGKKENVTLIFRGVDSTLFDPDRIEQGKIEALRNKWQMSGNSPVVMLPGRITRLKGQDIFLKSLQLLGNTDYIGVLVGDIVEKSNYYQELVELISSYGLGDKVKMVGHCSDMPAAYMVADIVVSASSSEPEAFGRTTVEAMAMGKPVVATAHGGSLETVVHGETGWLVPPSDSEAMANALNEALSVGEEERLRIGHRGRARVAARFTTKSMCNQTLQLYSQVLRQRDTTRNALN